MSLILFLIALIIIGGWNVTDAWISLSLYLKDPKQTWLRDHYIRVIRLCVGLLAWYLAWEVAKFMSYFFVSGKSL